MLNVDNDNMGTILFKASRLEEYGQKFFCLLSKLAKDEDSKRVFSQLSSEEEKHLNILKTIMKEKKVDEKEFLNFKAHDFFDKDLKKILKEGPVTALKYAIEIEQKAADFYYASLRYIDDHRVRRVFLDLIEAEEEHKEMLKKQLTGLMDSLLRELSRPQARKNVMPLAI